MSLVEKTAGLIGPRRGEVQNGSEPWTPEVASKDAHNLTRTETTKAPAFIEPDGRYSIPSKKKEVRVALGVRVTQQDMEQLEKLARKTNATKQSLIDIALRHLFDSNPSK